MFTIEAMTARHVARIEYQIEQAKARKDFRQVRILLAELPPEARKETT